MTPPEVEALQRALAGEHAAVYGYGVAGARLSGPARGGARAGYDAHLARRDQLTGLLVDAGQVPVPAEPAYELPSVGTAAEAVALALGIEERLGVVYGDVVAAAGGFVRELAARALQDTAVRAAGWRGGSVPFPGQPEG